MTTRKRIALAVTASVAATLTPKTVAALQEIGDVALVCTRKSKYFFDSTTLRVPQWNDDTEWTGAREGARYKKDQDIPHITIGDTADILVVAPLCANALTKFAVGLCDDLVSCLFYAWPQEKPVVVAPAMNTRMWENPLTERHLRTLTSQGVVVVPPVSKQLACGTSGMGAMADIADIVRVAARMLAT
ncbi:MAG: hypothetical protein RLZZ324_697 [Candidatus Parcubacteria bacterium]|jgi:phosphopantothenoylcysteine decarboxylase